MIIVRNKRIKIRRIIKSLYNGYIDIELLKTKYWDYFRERSFDSSPLKTVSNQIKLPMNFNSR